MWRCGLLSVSTVFSLSIWLESWYLYSLLLRHRFQANDFVKINESMVVSTVLNVHIHVNIFSPLFLAKRTLDFSIIYYWLFSVFHSTFPARTLAHHSSIASIILQHNWTTAASFIFLHLFTLLRYCLCILFVLLTTYCCCCSLSTPHNEETRENLKNCCLLLCCIDRKSLMFFLIVSFALFFNVCKLCVSVMLAFVCY